jgi:hypothetical protein
MRSMIGGSVTNATMRISSPQRGHASGSTSKMRREDAARRCGAKMRREDAGATIRPSAELPHSAPRARGRRIRSDVPRLPRWPYAAFLARATRTSHSSAVIPDPCWGCGSLRGPKTPGHRRSHCPQSGRYAVPSLIAHYIAAHRYKPPREFCKALKDCPSTKTRAYGNAL